MKLFADYLRQKWRLLAAGAVFLFIFLVSFLLYHLPVKAVLYPAALCVLPGLLFLFSGFFHTRKKHALLQNVRSYTDVSASLFPPPEGIEEKDYQQILYRICEEYGRYRTDTNLRRSDLTDYYTVWVHQIKTPIASMRLHLQNEDSFLSRNLSADLFRIEQYVEMVLTFLRLDSGSTDYVIQEYNLDSIVRETIKKFAGEFIYRKLNLVYEPLRVMVLTDEKWLSFVIGQLVSNALKYTPSGSITITLLPDKKLCIRDTGIGIAPEDLPRIFENGYTGYNGRLDKKATGLGLYLCKRICTNLGHTITAESVPDEGTAITIGLEHTKLEVE